MPRAIRMTQENLALIVAETNDDFWTHNDNMEFYADLHGENPICVVDGSKDVGNLVTTWWCTADFRRNYPEVNVTETEFVEFPRLSRK